MSLRGAIARRQRDRRGRPRADGVGRRDRDQDWQWLPRTYHTPSAQAAVVIRRARLRRPSAQQPTARRACTRSPRTPRTGLSLDAYHLAQLVDDLDEIGLGGHHRVDRLVGAGGLVNHRGVLAALDALGGLGVIV